MLMSMTLTGSLALVRDYFGSGSIPVIKDVSCTGSESVLLSCPSLRAQSYRPQFGTAAVSCLLSKFSSVAKIAMA